MAGRRWSGGLGGLTCTLPGPHKSSPWRRVPGPVQVAGPTEEYGPPLALLGMSVQCGQDVGVSLTAAAETKWKVSWEAGITSTVIYRSLRSHSLSAVCAMKERERLLRGRERNALIEPSHHKEIMSTGPVCAAFLQSVEKKSVLWSLRGSLSSAEAIVRMSAALVCFLPYRLPSVNRWPASSAEDKPALTEVWMKHEDEC